MSNWTEIGDLVEIPVLGARILKAYGCDIAIFRAADDQVFAIEDSCPHKGGPLSQGIMHGHHVTCPLHNWVIELKSGEAVAPDMGCVRRFPVRVEDGRVSLDLTDLLSEGEAAA